MPLFAMIFQDDLGVDVTDDVGARHREHFLGLGERAVLGGPTFNDEQALNGRLLIGEFPGLDEAKAWAAAEPFVQFGRSRISQVSAFVLVQDRGRFIPPPPGVGGTPAQG
jgi:uncharacterized protein YciI